MAKNPLDSVYFINLKDEKNFSRSAFSSLKIDPKIPLPVKMFDSDSEEAKDFFDPKQISAERILSGILTVLTYDSKNKNLQYYRAILTEIRPEIKKELSETAILKTKNGDFIEAQDFFSTLRAIDPDDVAIVLNTALFFDQWADSYRKSEQFEKAESADKKALDYYKIAMENEPAVPDAFFNAGFFYLKKHEYREAKDCFETFLALTCEQSDEEAGENGIYKKNRAQQIISEISNKNLDDEFFLKATQAINEGREAEGIENAKQFLQKNPKIWNAWFLLGWGLRKLGRFSDAKMAFLKSLECAGGENNAETFNEIAICYMEENNFFECEKFLKKALKINPENPKIISNLGFLALKMENFEKARAYFQAVLEYAPQDKIALLELSKLEN